MKLKKIIQIQITILFLFSWCMSLDFLPVDGQSLNYRQIFFRWPQIVGSESYEITIHHDMDFITYIAQNNSIILDDFSWQEEYSWEVCGLDGFNNSIDCYAQHNFNISPLPFNYPGDVNVITYNETLSTPGVTILDYESLNFSVALDVDGEPIWFVDRTNFPGNRITVTEFSTNGNFIGYGVGGYEFTMDGDIIFQTPAEFGVHHSIVKSDNDTYFFIDAEVELMDCPIECDTSLPNSIGWQGDRFLEVDKDGNTIWEWSTFDYLSSNEYNPQWVSTISAINDFDWTHSNSIFFNEDENRVYVSIRNLSRITAIDYTTKEIIWNLGDSDFMDEVFFAEDFGFSHQHSAQITDDGNLLFFDNGRDNNPEVSRCLEIEFDEDGGPDLIWEYVLPDSMLTLSRGECDRLSNGNTLISAGRTGNIIEVDENDEIVWHLRAKTNTGIDVSTYRSERVPSLYPNAFSVEINNLEGNYPSFSIVGGNIHITIYNNGWYSQTYFYELWSDSILLTVGDLFVQNESQSNIELVINGGNESDYTLKVYAENVPNSFQEVIFTQSSMPGDMNNDSILDILDIILMVNIIMSGIEGPGNADLDNDGLIDILDIVLLVNMILDD